MRIVPCDETDIHLSEVPCDGQITRAEIVALGRGAVPLSIHAGPVLRLPSPRPQHGVWTLRVTTPCGCFTGPVYLDCPAPRPEAVHTPTSSAPEGPTPVCCDEEDPPDPDPSGCEECEDCRECPECSKCLDCPDCMPDSPPYPPAYCQGLPPCPPPDPCEECTDCEECPECPQCLEPMTLCPALPRPKGAAPPVPDTLPLTFNLDVGGGTVPVTVEVLGSAAPGWHFAPSSTSLVLVAVPRVAERMDGAWLMDIRVSAPQPLLFAVGFTPTNANLARGLTDDPQQLPFLGPYQAAPTASPVDSVPWVFPPATSVDFALYKSGTTVPEDLDDTFVAINVWSLDDCRTDDSLCHRASAGGEVSFPGGSTMFAHQSAPPVSIEVSGREQEGFSRQGIGPQVYGGGDGLVTFSALGSSGGEAGVVSVFTDVEHRVTLNFNSNDGEQSTEADVVFDPMPVTVPSGVVPGDEPGSLRIDSEMLYPTPFVFPMTRKVTARVFTVGDSTEARLGIKCYFPQEC